MTNSLVIRLILSFFAYKFRSTAGEGAANELWNGLRHIFPNQLLGSVDEIIGARDISQELEKAFDQADECFRRSTPFYLAGINSSGGVPFRGISVLKEKAKGLSEDAEAEFLVVLLRHELTKTAGSVLTSDQIEQCVSTYVTCLQEEIYKHFPSERGIINLLYKNIEDTREIHITVDRILQVVEAFYNRSGDRPRVKILPPKWYDSLIGRDQEVESIYQQVLHGNKRIIVLYGPSGVGVSSIAREVIEKLDKLTPSTDEQPNANVFPIWFKVPAVSRNAEGACEKLKDWISNALGIDSQSDAYRQETLQDGFIVLVVDGLRHEVASDILDYIHNIQFPNVRIVVTCPEELPWETYHLYPERIRIGGVDAAHIPELFRRHGYDRPLSDEQRKQLANQTGGNIQRLIRIALDLKKGFTLKRSLERDAETDWEIVQKLSEPARYMLKIISLYEEFVHENVLVSIFEREYRHETSKALDELTNRLIISPDPSSFRYTIDDGLRKALKEMETEGEYDAIRDQWTDFYCSLRKERKSDLNDEIGWTIFTDYQPEDSHGVRYADEANNILDVIKYCLSDTRIATHGQKAAQLLDDFRATIFASGRWEDRLIYCEQVIAFAQSKNDLALLGKFYRLLAWIHCFRDEYEEGKRIAREAIKVARNGLQTSHLTESDRYTHQQTLYKAYNTLGQIALRDARRSAWAGRRIRKALEDANPGPQADFDAGDNLSVANAVDQFQEAEISFAQALLMLEEYPPEALIMKYHLAEVKYYDRDPVTATQPAPEAFYTFEQLNRVLPLFLNILKKAQEPYPDPEFDVTRPHQRLIANTQLYLGKILRRKAALALMLGKPNAEEYMAEAKQSLENAFIIAETNNDRVLKAKIKFAQCQWYESRAGSTQDPAKIADFLSEAKRLALESVQEFQVTHMRLEYDDAQAFYERRLSTDA